MFPEMGKHLHISAKPWLFSINRGGGACRGKGVSFSCNLFVFYKSHFRKDLCIWLLNISLFPLRKLSKTTSHNFWDRLFWQLSFRIKKHILGVISHWPNLCIWWWEVPPKVLQEPEKRRQRRILAGVKTYFWLRRNNYYICFPFAQGHRHVCLRLQLLWADGLQVLWEHLQGPCTDRCAGVIDEA